MSQLFHLEEFKISKNFSAFGAGQSHTGSAPGDDEAEAVRIAAYEQGYKAGWDDASQAAGDDQTRIGTEFSHNLQDLGFTFHEARSHVIRSLEPLLLALVEKLLPELVAQTMGQRVLEEIIPLAETAADAPIQVVICPENRPALEPLLTENATSPFEIIEEPSLGSGQVYLRSGKIERHIDLDQVVMNIAQAILAMGQENGEAFSHG